MKTQIFDLAGMLGEAKKTPLENFVQALSSGAQTSGALGNQNIARFALGVEGHGVDEMTAGDTLRSIKQRIEMARREAGFESATATRATSGNITRSVSKAVEQAGVLAAVLARDPSALMNKKFGDVTSLKGMASPTTRVIGLEGLSDALTERARPALEAYDASADKALQNFSIAWNMEALTQCEFGAAFYPAVVVMPGSMGFTSTARVVLTYSEVQRKANGEVSNFNRQNLIRALIDANIMAADQTRLIPVYRKAGTANADTDSFSKFVDTTLVATKTLTVDNAPLTTAPLAVGVTLDLLALCQTDASLAQGLNDQTDAIAPSVRLENIYIKLVDGATTEVIAVPVKDLPLSDFNPAPQGNTQAMQLNFNTKAIRLTSSTKTVSGAASTILSGLGTNTAYLEVTGFGNVDRMTGRLNVMFPSVSTAFAYDVNGNQLSLTAAPASTFVTKLNAASVIGFDLLAFRANSNHRSRGKLIDAQTYNYLYAVPPLPPITSLRPIGDADTNDAQLLSDLVGAARVQQENRAVTALLDAASLLNQYGNSADVVANHPELFGVGSFLVNPTYVTDSLDASTINSLTDAERANDFQSMLFNKLRDMAISMYVQSGYGPALMTQGGAPGEKPVVIIGTDPKLYRYLQLTGDTRLLGEMFDYHIVQTFDSRMAGKIVFSFGRRGSFDSGVQDPLHFGTLAWRPELTSLYPFTRNGQQSMELTVTPSYRYINNLPVLGQLTVTNIESIMGGKKIYLSVQNKVVA